MAWRGLTLMEDYMRPLWLLIPQVAAGFQAYAVYHDPDRWRAFAFTVLWVCATFAFEMHDKGLKLVLPDSVPLSLKTNRDTE